MKKYLTKIIIGVLCLMVGLSSGFLLYGAWHERDLACAAPESAYLVEGVTIQLREGVHILPMSEGSDTVIVTRIDHMPVVGRMSDGALGAAVVLTRQNARNETSLYLALLREGGEPVPAVLLGQECLLVSLKVEEEIIEATVLVPKKDQPITSGGTLQTHRYVLRGGVLAMLP